MKTIILDILIIISLLVFGIHTLFKIEKMQYQLNTLQYNFEQQVGTIEPFED